MSKWIHLLRAVRFSGWSSHYLRANPFLPQLPPGVSYPGFRETGWLLAGGSGAKGADAVRCSCVENPVPGGPPQHPPTGGYTLCG
jgi:hypothetical protein